MRAVTYRNLPGRYFNMPPPRGTVASKDDEGNGRMDIQSTLTQLK
jgi:hypothetical protein